MLQGLCLPTSSGIVMLMLSLRCTSYQLSVGYYVSYCSCTKPTECGRAIAEATFTFYLPKPRTSNASGPRMSVTWGCDTECFCACARIVSISCMGKKRGWHLPPTLNHVSYQPRIANHPHVDSLKPAEWKVWDDDRGKCMH